MKKTKDSPFFLNHIEWKTPNTYDSLNYLEPTNNSGVYLLVFCDLSGEKIEYEILYIGSAKNLNKRYSNHEVLRILKSFYPYIRFYFKEVERCREVEKLLIKSTQPKFNKQWL